MIKKCQSAKFLLQILRLISEVIRKRCDVRTRRHKKGLRMHFDEVLSGRFINIHHKMLAYACGERPWEANEALFEFPKQPDFDE